MSSDEVLGYRLRMEVERPIADYLFKSPMVAFAVVLMQCRRPWNGDSYVHLRGKSLGLNWSTINYPVYHPMCIDASFQAFDPVDKNRIFSGELRSYRMPGDMPHVECLSADPVFRLEAFERGMRSVSDRLSDWSGGDPDIARVLTIFAGQMPFHPFWKMKAPGGQKLAIST